MSGVLITAFNDLLTATDSVYLNDRDNLFNDASLRTYTIARMMDGDTTSLMLDGGDSIAGHVQLSDTGTYRTVRPQEFQNWSNPQPARRYEYQWRFALNEMTYTDQEILLNGSANESSDMRFARYFSLIKAKEQYLWTSQFNGMEQNLWVEPDPSTMEGTGGKETYSIPAFVNEFANGLFLDTPGGAFTQVGAIDPTATGNTNWDCQRVTYDSDATTTTAGNLADAMRSMKKKLLFGRPNNYQEYFESAQMRKQMIFTSLAGYRAYSLVLEGGNDQWVIQGKQDSDYPDPQFQGYPVEYCEQLDTATLYPNTGDTDNVTEGDSDAKSIGPRFYFIDGSTIFPVFHELRYFEKEEPGKHHNVPDTWVCPVWTYWNLICKSRRHSGLVSPDGDQFTGLVIS